MTQKHTQGTVSFGGPTVLTVLIVLCFACFSLLALSRASADYRLSARAAQTVSDYYAAKSSVQSLLFEMDLLCDAPPAQVGERLPALAEQHAVEAALSDDGMLLTLCVRAGSQGMLTTEVRLRAAGKGTDWTVQSSRVIPDDPEPAESTLPVIQ